MNDKTPQTPATPDGAASVLTAGLGGRDRAHWLADKIAALGDYAREAATVLRKQADELAALYTQKPVAWQHPMDIGRYDTVRLKPESGEWIPLFAGPTPSVTPVALVGAVFEYKEYRAIDTGRLAIYPVKPMAESGLVKGDLLYKVVTPNVK